MSGLAAKWREDLDALQFGAVNHGGVCIVHRLAFRRLLGFTPDRDDCIAYFAGHVTAFGAAASAKIAVRRMLPACNFHLDSRDIRRQLLITGQMA
ncbi:hypothetical protein LJR231_005698 [Phyllobacterium sp. LjRoot231]|uniref:hypothetical protein n=1 Tax=Phyllobacterium sp. LjRoot231 TaxID=3342289 RepID=UPI003ECD016D